MHTKHLVFLAVLMVFFTCKPAGQVNTISQKTAIITDKEVASIIDTLSSDYYEGRGFGSEGINKAAVYIENYLKDLKIKPYFTQYRDSFVVRNSDGFNIIGLIEGTDPKLKNEYIILSAHYDHIGKEFATGDSVYNGANDNATGVSTVLNIAKKIHTAKANKRSIILALFSGEEIGLTGSRHFAKKTKDSAQAYYCAVNVDMIGSPINNKKGKVYLSGFERSNMGTVFNQHINNDTILAYDNSGFFDVFRLSDNYPLFNILKIPAHTFCTFNFQNYEHYHKLSDEIENVDIKNTAMITRNIHLVVEKISNTPEQEIRLIKEKE